MSARAVAWLCVLTVGCVLGTRSIADDEPGRTTLSNPAIRYRLPEKPYVVLQRGDVRAVVVDNSAVDDDVLPGHRAGYSGLGSLTHVKRKENLFVPSVAGLNYEHIHDGTTRERDILFEPRRAPMELRVIAPHVVELYQQPTPTWALESALRYEMLADGAIEMTLECRPRKKTFTRGYIGLFWASYIHQPESLDIHFLGRDVGEGGGFASQTKWIRGVTPAHGTLSTHLALDDDREFPHDEGFPLSLVYNRSKHRYAEPWYYGVSHGMAYVQMFRRQDRVRLTQSPSGGGRGNPAWDFQYFIPDYERDRVYRLVMRVLYVPYESAEQIERVSAPHRKALNP